MDPATIAALSGALPVVGGLIGQGQAASARTDAENARKEALAQFAGISVPEIEDQMLHLQEYQSQGKLNPLLEQLVSQGDTNLNNVQLDPRLKASQMSALEQIAGLASGQPQPGDIAGMELARRNAAAEAQAKQGQIMQEMQQRGQAGSGAELLAKLKASQSGADMLSQAQMQQAQMMQQARLQALQSQSNMASNVRAQDYSQQSDLARAKDAINQFNTQNAQGVNSRNTVTANNAQSQNLQNTQNIANMNVDTKNKEQVNNKGLIQQRFNNQMGLAGAKAGQYQTQAQSDDARAAQTAAMWGGIGQGAGTAIASMNNKK